MASCHISHKMRRSKTYFQFPREWHVDLSISHVIDCDHLLKFAKLPLVLLTVCLHTTNELRDSMCNTNGGGGGRGGLSVNESIVS